MTETTVHDGSQTPAGPHRTLAAGEVLGGYRIDGFLGRGGMGVVYRAWDPTLERPVAIKVLPWTSAEPFRSRFLREAQLAAALDHPHVVPIYAWGESGESVHIVMRLVEGVDLRRLVDEQGPLAPARAIRLLRQAASALDAAHAPEKGLIHRDVKPHNLLLADPGGADHLYLADFGLARSDVLPGSATVSYEPGTGTASYMAPEQIRGEPLDFRCDLYALASVGVFLLTGQAPFVGASPMEIAVAQLHDAPPSLAARIPGLPAGFDEAFAQGLAKDPGARPPSCRDFVALLEAALAGRSVVGPRAARLPVALTSFVGRDADVAEIRAAITTNRLVCLTGPGGVGKSRLALAALDGWSGAPAPVLVELAGISDGGAVPAAVAGALTITAAPGESVPAALRTRIATAPLLLLMDNCEHVLPDVTRLLGDLLGVCPNLRVLATSRVPLDLAGETVVGVGPLPVPRGDGTDNAVTLASCPSVELFLARAASSGAALSLEGEDGAAVSAICRRLDGIPLAIELAARRARAMAPTEIARRIDDALGLLTGGDRGAPARQRTLAATMQWTYDLLEPSQQAGFRWLSVFSGGFDLAAAEAVLGVAPAVGYVPDAVADLVDWSLVVRDPDVVGRYRLLETARAFGARLLGADEPAARTAHLSWCTYLAGEAATGQNTPAEAQWATRIDIEFDNLRAAFSFAGSDAASPEAMCALTAPLTEFLIKRSHAAAVRGWGEQALARGGGADRDRLRTAAGVAYIAALQGELETATRWAGEAIVGFTARGDHEGLARAELALGVAADAAGDPVTCGLHLEAALVASRAGGAIALEGKALGSLGVLAVRTEGLERGRELMEAALELARRAGDRSGEGQVAANLGLVALRQGDPAAAERYLAQAQDIQVAIGERRGLCLTRSNLGALALERGDGVGAREAYLGSLRIAVQDGLRAMVLVLVEALAETAAAAGGHTEAASLHGLAAAARAASDLPSPPDVLARHEARLEVSREALGAAEFEAATAQGRALELSTEVDRLLGG